MELPVGNHLANADRRWLYNPESFRVAGLPSLDRGSCLSALEHPANAGVCRLDIQKEGKRTQLRQRAERSLQVDCGYVVSLLPVPSFLVQLKMYIGFHVESR
jgi:hypothetical protein